MRRKLIEQVVYKGAMIQSFAATSSTAHVTTTVDRLGYLSAYVVAQAIGGTGADTQEFNFYVYDSSDNSTFAIYDSANATSSLAPSLTTASATGFNVDLAGANRYFRVYATVTGATTITATVSVAVILGDAAIEPAV
ncbi:MAG: hypothetical protein PHO15_00390 [Eubacteriales bacterium]|nr:hypothetical protein [Eubacteriales bacterium]